MRITFLVPFRKNSPVGGLKIMYEYANHLAEKGHTIRIMHFRERFQRYSPFMYPIARTLKVIENNLFGRWFKFNKQCKQAYIRYVNDDTMPDADVIIYTWCSLGFLVEKLSPAKGIKINLIQDYETWTEGIDELHRSYDLPGIHNIVIAEYLRKIVSQYTNKPVFLLHNAIDTTVFNISTAITERDPKTVCMLYHEEPRKGTAYGLRALELIQKEVPGFKAILFGVYKKPAQLPSCVEYHRKPKNLSALYNRAAIYFTNSLQEGWGLPSVEAMACGCALVCTDIGGHHSYANSENAVLVMPERPGEMAAAVIDLIKNPEKRNRLAKEGNRSIQQFSWEHAVVQLEEYIRQIMYT
jgi:glycosyltransferase involved in cell wall biosynthesis